MRPRDRVRGQQLHQALVEYGRDIRRLAGLNTVPCRTAFVEQLLESIHRVEYVQRLAERDISPNRADPNSDLFDPLKGAIIQVRNGQIDEAFWLVFLSVHFGKNLRTGWLLTREIYGMLGAGNRWDWARTSTEPDTFRTWLAENRNRIRGRFGNHRKYASLDPDSGTGTAAVIGSYVRWIQPPRTHETFIVECQQRVGHDRRILFQHLYDSLNAVTYFGRMAKFDFLTMLGKLNLAPIEPGSIYMDGATGPFTGARLLFGGTKDAPIARSMLDPWCVQLGAQLDVGMQVLEDALCNWQKSPNKFIPFRG